MMTIGRCVVVASFVLAACGGGSGGTANGGASITGTIHGQPVNVVDAISAGVSVNLGTTTANAAAILLGSSSGQCNDAMNNLAHPNEKAVAILLFDVNGMTLSTPTAPGTYTVPEQGSTTPAKAASMALSVLDGTCQDVTASEASATSGTVTLTNVSSNSFAGTLDLTLDSGDHITGDFTPEACPALQTAVNSMVAATCK